MIIVIALICHKHISIVYIPGLKGQKEYLFDRKRSPDRYRLCQILFWHTNWTGDILMVQNSCIYLIEILLTFCISDTWSPGWRPTPSIWFPSKLLTPRELGPAPRWWLWPMREVSNQTNIIWFILAARHGGGTFQIDFQFPFNSKYIQFYLNFCG